MNKKRDYYAVKMLALILLGMAGVYALIYLIGQAIAQKSIVYEILLGLAAILLAPLINTITGFFDDSVEPTPASIWNNYWRVLVSLVFQLLFIVCMFPFIALYLVATLGAILLFVIIVGYIIYFFQQVLHINLGALNDFGLWELTKYFLIVATYEGLFFLGYYFCSKNDEKIWNWIRGIFNR